MQPPGDDGFLSQHPVSGPMHFQMCGAMSPDGRTGAAVALSYFAVVLSYMLSCLRGAAIAYVVSLNQIMDEVPEAVNFAISFRCVTFAG